LLCQKGTPSNDDLIKITFDNLWIIVPPSTFSKKTGSTISFGYYSHSYYKNDRISFSKAIFCILSYYKKSQAWEQRKQTPKFNFQLFLRNSNYLV
jgi:hypothetical protein